MREPGLAHETAWGVVWAFVATGVSRLVWLGALAYLARLVAPDRFGLFAFGLVFLTFVETVGDLGTGVALIQWPRRVPEAAHVTFYLSLATGALWFGLAQLVAPWVAAFFHDPSGEPLVRVLALSFLIRALGNTHDALCQKELRFKARVIPETALTATKGVVAITLASAGFGVWSLVWGQLAGLALQAAALWAIVPWRPTGRFPRDLVAPMLAYGRGVVVANLLAAVIAYGDLVVVGRMLGPTVLGYYQMAAKVPEIAVTVGVWVVSRVLFAAFSRAHATGRELGRGFVTALRYVGLLTVPVAAGLVLVAEPLVLGLFGEAWLPSVPILRALAVYVGFRALGSQAGSVLKATGRTGLLAGLAVGRAVVLVPALIAAARWGALAVAATLAAVTGLATAVDLAVASRGVGVPLLRVARAIGPSLAGGAAMTAALVAWRAWGSGIAGSGPVSDLVLRVLLGAAVYTAAAYAAAPGLVAEARASLGGSAPPREAG